MLKRIHVQQLRLGMHLKEFCGSWMDHPFWRTGFVLKDMADLDLILASAIKEVWIDCSKGLDVAKGETVISELHEDALDAPAAPAPDLIPGNLVPRDIKPISAAQEVERAARICLEGKADRKSVV